MLETFLSSSLFSFTKKLISHSAKCLHSYFKLQGYVYLFRAHYCISVYFSGSNTPIFSESQKFFVMKIFSSHSWNILSLHCCLGFGCIAKRFHYTYIFQILFPHTLLQGTQHRFLFYTEGPCQSLSRV